MVLLVHKAKLIDAVFHSPDVLDEARFRPKYFTRKRKMPYDKLLHFMLSGRKATAQASLDEYFKLAGDEIHMSQQAYSKARNHFDHSPFRKAFYVTRDADYADDSSLGRFLGFKIFAVDGSLIPLPNIPALREEFGAIGAGATSPTARASIAYDVINDQIVDADITPLSTDERTLASQHLDALKGIIQMEDSIFIYDRGYASESLVRKITGTGIGAYFLMRVRRKFNLDVDAAPMGSSYVKLADDLEVRVVKFELSSGETETLITNLSDLDEGLFQELYFKRWPVEVKYDIIKNKLELPNFTGWSSNVIRQDFWISMLLANVAATAKTEADIKIKEERSGKENKYEYQANVNTVIASLRSRFADAVFEEDPDRRTLKIGRIIKEVAKSAVPIRPNRDVSRVKNSRKVKYHHNKKSNI